MLTFTSTSIVRSRVRQGALLGLVITLGLASRLYGYALPPPVALYAGDTLWAVAAFLSLSLIWPAASLGSLVTGTALITLAVELSQLAHPAWLEALRQWPGARLLLGYGFFASDLLCYAVGILLSIVIDRSFARGAQVPHR